MNSPQPDPSERFKPNATREMASMFDDVSGRYDLLNRVMTLGQDVAWREAMWRRVPHAARTVLDLCTGSGSSLTGLSLVGRTVLGIDVSLRMLRAAASARGGGGWTPRLVCADGFHLPLRTGSLDAVTVAFGIRNLRPRPAALAEITRVLRPGGRLVVLEASVPTGGPLAPLARTWIRHAIPLAGRLSPDPSAYRYLSRSIFDFGSGEAFESDLDAAGFTRLESRSLLFGAARLWVAESGSALGQKATAHAVSVRSATPHGGKAVGSGVEHARGGEGAEGWRLLQAITSLALAAALVWALAVWVKVHDHLPLTPPQRAIGWGLLVAGPVFFSVRGAVLALRWVAARGAGGAFR